MNNFSYLLVAAVSLPETSCVGCRHMMYSINTIFNNYVLNDTPFLYLCGFFPKKTVLIYIILYFFCQTVWQNLFHFLLFVMILEGKQWLCWDFFYSYLWNDNERTETTLQMSEFLMLFFVLCISFVCLSASPCILYYILPDRVWYLWRI